MDQNVSEPYMRAYMDGYTAALEKVKGDGSKPYLDLQDIIDRYDGKIGINKAREIMRAVRRVCNGGKLDSCSLVLRSEIEYWESIVDKQFKKLL